jgi:glucosamine kinase
MGRRAAVTEALYLGIDGGGTACRARLADGSGRVLGEGLAGSSNLTLGIDTAAAAIRQAAEHAFEAACVAPDRRKHVHAGYGLAGANVPSLANAVMALPHDFASLAVASDAVAACLGAHDGRDGAILILGTGSQGLAFVDGIATAIGGWGFAISDQGSAAILGRHAVRAAVLAADGLAPRSAMTEAVMARYQNNPAEAVIWAKGATPRDYGALSPLVFDHAAAGDGVAIRLMDEAVGSVAAMLDRLLGLGADRVALMGGLARPYRPWLPERFSSILVEPHGDALDGAIALARRSHAR